MLKSWFRLLTRQFKTKIFSEEEQTFVSKYITTKRPEAGANYRGAWLGVTDLYSRDPQNPTMEWYHQGTPSYTNWVYGQPEMTETKWPGTTCGSIDAGAEESGGQWSANYCRNERSSLCQRRRFLGRTGLLYDFPVRKSIEHRRVILADVEIWS